MQYATLYLADPSIVGSKVLNNFSQIISYADKSDDDKATGIVIKLTEAEIDMNFMPYVELGEHLEGFKGFAYDNICQNVDPQYVLSRIHNVRLVIGCVVNPQFDEAGKIFQFLQSLNKAYNSLLFCNNRVFDYDMQMLVRLNIN